MSSVEDKSKQRVVGVRRRPGQRGMTILAIRAQSGHRMVGVGRSLIVGGMAEKTIGRDAGIFIFPLVDVTTATIGRGMAARERKPCGRVLAHKTAGLPARRMVTMTAILSELTLVHILVALVTVRPRHDESEVVMTGPAGDRLVKTQQRKTGFPIVIKSHAR